MQPSLRSLWAFFFFSVPLFGAARPVIVISIDGLSPRYVIEADRYGLKIPTLRRLLKEGTYAEGVAGVTPTLTYPSHTTLMTGVSPEKHGIFSNLPLDIEGKNDGGWFWYAQDIHVPTLWDAATAAGRKVGMIDWPVTIGAPVAYRIPQHWRATHRTPDDAKLTRALATPGLMEALEKEAGPYPAGYRYTVEDDRMRARWNRALIEKKRPDLHLSYLSSLDEEQHAVGPFQARDFAVLEAIDTMVGEIWDAAQRAYRGKAVVCVLSDHGFARVDKEMHINAIFREENLLRVDDAGRVTDWQAYGWSADGSLTVLLKDPADPKLATKVEAIVHRLAKEEGTGIARVYRREEHPILKRVSGAEWLLDARSGFAFGRDARGTWMRDRTPPSGEHGYLPENRDMDAAFFIVGPGIVAGKRLGRIDMRDVAPTLAKILNVKLPQAEGKDVLR